MSDSYYKGAPTEESRQQYATAEIQRLQRIHWRPLTFAELLDAFHTFGEEYDNGVRLRDLYSRKMSA